MASADLVQTTTFICKKELEGEQEGQQTNWNYRGQGCYLQRPQRLERSIIKLAYLYWTLALKEIFL